MLANKHDATMMHDAIQDLDVFQRVWNMPCWFNDNEQFHAIAAVITGREHWDIVNLSV